MKRVLLITDIFPPHIGGPATFIDHLARRISALGHRATVVCSSDNHTEPSDKDRPFKVRRITGDRVARYIKTPPIILKEMLSHRNILVNGHENVACRMAQLAGRDYVLKVVGDVVWEAARNLGWTDLDIDRFQREAPVTGPIAGLQARRRRFVQRARLIITPSDYLRQMVIGWGKAPDAVVTVANGVDQDEYAGFEATRRTGDVLEVVFVGRLTNWKGVETLLLAVERLPRARVTIIGDGPELPHLKELSAQLTLTEKVRFTGRLDRASMKSAMAGCHVLVLASLYEGLSHTLLEAMSMGIPCIASGVGGNPEVITHDADGLLVQPQHVDELRESLASLERDEPRRFRLAQGARQKARRFDLRETAEKTLELVVV
jgi:glycosyltransferase involved in cell wall biosynthesis